MNPSLLGFKSVNLSPQLILIITVPSYLQGNRKGVNKDELKPTVQALDKTQSLCQHHKGASDLIADIGTLFNCLK